MNERAAADSQKNKITHSQIRGKFKKLVCKCKSISLNQQIASAISFYQVKKACGKWWDILFLLVVSRESVDPSNIFEPPFYNDNQNTDPENDLRGSKNKKMSNPNKETIKKSLLTLTKLFIGNDPIEKWLKCMAEEKKKSRKQEMKMTKLMFSLLHRPFQEPSSSMHFH